MCVLCFMASCVVSGDNVWFQIEPYKLCLYMCFTYAIFSCIKLANCRIVTCEKFATQVYVLELSLSPLSVTSIP